MAAGELREFSRDEILQTLSAILVSDNFADSPQLSEFLKFIVCKTVNGEQEDIKAYTIAVDALGRPEDFDPQSNSFVRVAAGRLRRTLALYNAKEMPRDASLFITLEPGSYVPTFHAVEKPNVSPQKPAVLDDEHSLTRDEEVALGYDVASANKTVVPREVIEAKNKSSDISISRRAFVGGLCVIAALIIIGIYYSGMFGKDEIPGTLAGVPNGINNETTTGSVRPINANRRPSIEVSFLIPEKSYPDWFKTGEVADALRISFARFDDYQFNGLRVYKTPPSRDKQRADYHLWATAYRRGDAVRIYGQIYNEFTGEVIWSQESLFSRPDNLQERDVPDVVGSYLAVLASPYGVIYSDVIKHQPNRKKLNCVVWAYSYFSSETDEKHRKARNCAERLVKEGTTLPSIYAALTFLYLDEYRQGRNKKDRDPLRAAEEMAERAIQFNPASARAHQALFAVHKVRGNIKQARLFANKALMLNPYDVDIMGDYGAWLISIGNNHEGRELIERVIQLQSAPPAWLEFYRFLGAELDGDFVEADAVASVLDTKRSPLVAIAVAISSHRKGNGIKSAKAIAELTRSNSGFKKNPAEALVQLGFATDVADRVADKLVAAGLEVATPSLN